MAKDTQRDKARATFGKAFFENTKCPPAPKNSMVAQQKVANSRPIPTFKVGGVVKQDPAAAASRRAIRADQDFTGLRDAAAAKAAAKGRPVMKKGGEVSDEYTAKRVTERVKAGNFKDGGKAARASSRYDRRMADIESDFAKAMKGATGRDAEVAKAKREQRLADARDDLAKAKGEDRTKTRAAERAAERSLTHTRKYGATPTIKVEAPTAAKASSSADVAAATAGMKAPSTTPAPAARAKARPARSQARAAAAPAAPKAAPKAAPAAPRYSAALEKVMRAPIGGRQTNTSYDRAESEARRRNLAAAAANRLQVVGGARANPNRPDQMRRTDIRPDEVMSPAERAAAYRAKLTRTAGIGAMKSGGETKPVKRAVGGAGKTRKGMVKDK